MDKKKKTILEESQEIIFERSEEKQRDYGPIDKSFEDTATIASIITGKKLTAEDCYKVMIALKMSRMKRSYKRDTYLDTIGYIGALAEMLEKGKEAKSYLDALEYQLNIDFKPDKDDADEATE